MSRALIAEVWKLKRASLPLWTVVTVCVAPMLSNVFSTASQTSWEQRTSWGDFMGLGSMTMGTWYGFLLFGLITAFVFGREYTEGVAATVMTTPVRREQVVIAKLVVLTGWVYALTFIAVAAQAAWATALGLGGMSWEALWTCLSDMLLVATLIVPTLPLVAVIAVLTKGVFAPMIFSAFGFAAGMLGGLAGWSDWLPWAMPVAVAGSFMGDLPALKISELSGASWAVLAGIAIVGVAVLLVLYNRADGGV